MAKVPPPPATPEPASPAALRVQVLATEHWSLLASRSTTQSEVLVRIGMFLTFVSATLVSLALVGQADDFGPSFRLVAVTLLAVAVLIGVLTQVRVSNVGMEDLMYVIAMNRLRGAYLELVPEIAPAFMSGTTDDLAGMSRTYYFLGNRTGASQVLGSSMIFIIAVNGTLTGLLAASIVVVSGGAMAPAVVVGVAVMLTYLVIGAALGGRDYLRFWRDWKPQYPSPSQG